MPTAHILEARFGLPVYHAHVEMVELLLRYGAKVSIPNHERNESTAYEVACCEGDAYCGKRVPPQKIQMAIYKAMLPKIAKMEVLQDFQVWSDAVFDEESEDEYLGLHQAVKYGDAETLEDLLKDTKFDEVPESLHNHFHARDSKKRTALDLAALTGQIDLMNILKAAGAKHGWYPGKMPSIARLRSVHARTYRAYVQSTSDC